ncbi:alpha-1-antitrypsin-like isoform X2 [Protopterus annectens]|uniref:alpha-1-antitrypsin-like isoform X2 n=1 Tax=Protopterus annectens TaxID=7888 RepID=UPI001CF974D9|nr:alpha-1-antitrypsin-like isoform X2 [Protopterus annectens]
MPWGSRYLSINSAKEDSSAKTHATETIYIYYIKMEKSIFLCAVVIFLVTGINGDHQLGHHRHAQHHRRHSHRHSLHHPNAARHNRKPHTEEVLSYHAIASNNFEFGSKLFKLVASKPDWASKNIFFSPFSISSAFGMLSLGARFDTLTQIQEGLCFNVTDSSDTEIHQNFEEALDALNNRTDEVHLFNGNAVFVREGAEILPTFLDDTQRYYAASALSTDFKNKEEAVKQINEFVEKKTHGKIIKALQEVDPETVVLLVSYIMFQGTWEKPFNPKNTKEEDFFIDADTTVKVPMMYRPGVYKVFQDSHVGCTFLELPYKGAASLFLILPDAGKMEDVVESLSFETVLKWHHSTIHRFASVSLPKFSIATSYDLKELLIEMGIADVFSDSADLSGITGNRDLKVSKALHKAILDVDETGTEAAAVTIIELTPRTAIHEQYSFNRPFLFLVCENETKMILFMGKLANPSEISEPN